MPDGLSSEDFRRQAAVTSLKRNSNGHRDDPLDEVVSAQKKVLGSRMMNQLAATADTERIQAENQRLEAEIKHQQLQEQAHETRASPGYVGMMMDQYRESQAKLIELSEKLAERDRQLLDERLAMLTGELERVREQGNTQIDAMTQALETFEKARQLNQLVAPPATTEPATPAVDPHLTAWLKTQDIQQERWRVQHADDREIRLQELDIKREEIRERLRMEKEHNDTMDKFYHDLAPRALAVGEKLIGIWEQSRVGGVTAASVTQPPPEPAPSPAAQVVLPPGAVAASCARCGANIVYMTDWPGVICSSCGALYNNRPAPVEAEPQAQDVEEVAG